MTNLTREQQIAAKPAPVRSDPVDTAVRLAGDQLAEEIFREESELDAAIAAKTGMSKLERDALIRQAMDFESRKQVDEAIICYEKAIRGGLRMTAAYFNLGILYLRQKQNEKARRIFGVAVKDATYAEAVKLAYARAQKSG